jgi:type III pantothenate kinase
MANPPALLLVDVGNTRIKWRYLARGLWNSEDIRGSVSHAAVAQLGEDWREFGFGRVEIANVAGIDALDQVIAAARAAHPSGTFSVGLLIPSRMQCGVTNCYPAPERLGADRWAALIGTHALGTTGSAAGEPRATSIIVSLGTATTIDVLSADGEFIGGVILPGVATMRSALALNTAELPHAEGRYSDLAANTEDAIASGILHAQAGAIERVRHRVLERAFRCDCTLCGGDAPLVAPLLPFPARIEEDLVLRGLYEIARPKSARPVSDPVSDDRSQTR